MTNLVPIHFVRSMDDATTILSQSKPCMVSRVPALDLKSHARTVSAGAYDFDGTLISGSQWIGMEQLVPQNFHPQMNASRTWFFSHRNTGTNGMSVNHPDWFHSVIERSNDPVAEAAWVAETFQIYKDARIAQKQVYRVGQQLIPREGAIALLNLLERRVIISMGIEQVIAAWLQHYMISSPIAASRLLFEQDVVSGFHFNLVVGNTKQTAVARYCKMAQIPETHLLVLGDSAVDATMMYPNSFNVLILPLGEKDDRISAYRLRHIPDMWDRLTLILQSDSLLPLVQLIKSARNSP